MAEIENYEEQVYAALLGKAIGVYMGRPIEGWRKHEIEDRFGVIDRYVNEDLGHPLIVPDDDITGTLTFYRILEDSGDYQNTAPELFGENWLNYIVPLKSILWWGGMGCSTEHTAFERLRQGFKAPESGSAKLNGKTVSEQIGAQIFIDAFGLCAPGDPELAADLAKRAAEVSHDGEAVYGAIVVAAMVSAAFAEKEMDRLLDIGVSLIPDDCLIAKVHRDVRRWVEEDQDWNLTYEKIKAKYGYDRYSGNCHMIPNHAIMVMAWAYAPDNFHLSQMIINSAGWDTDCNAANVGAVMGLVVGLEGIDADYDYRGPLADRLILPTAEGTRGISDCATEAISVANVGRKVMGWKPLEAPKHGAWHHFALPGSLHGYMADTASARVTNGGGCLKVETDSAARVSTPICSLDIPGSYDVMGTPRLYSGMEINVSGRICSGPTDLRLFISSFDNESKEFSILHHSEEVVAEADGSFSFNWRLPDTGGEPIGDFGFELSDGGSVEIDHVSYGGSARVAFPDQLSSLESGSKVGWIQDIDHTRMVVHEFRGMQFFGKNRERGHLVTGTLDWKDYEASADLMIHSGDLGGLVINYQGLRRYLALVLRGSEVQLLRVLYGEEVVASAPVDWNTDEIHHLKLRSDGDRVTAFVDGQELFEHRDASLCCGGSGFICQNGNGAFSGFSVSPTSGPQGK